MKKTIFITGATAGFGESCARRFAAEGWHLILTGRRQDKLDRLADELAQQTMVYATQLDVRELTMVQDVVDGLPKDFKSIDILLNNAGLALGLEPAHAADIKDWDTMVDTNIKGLMYCTRTILPLMVDANNGHVINIGSIAGSWPYAGGNAYGATKAFVQQFSRNLRTDLLGTKVRVTNVEPGMADTEFSLVRFKGDAEKAKKVYEGLEPLTGEDIADIVYWVATSPKHVNINAVEVMPVCQSWEKIGVKPTD